jgi:hypothetical protein
MISQVHINLKIYPIAMFDQRPVIPCTLAELVDATLMECYQKHGDEVRGPHA